MDFIHILVVLATVIIDKGWGQGSSPPSSVATSTKSYLSDKGEASDAVPGSHKDGNVTSGPGGALTSAPPVWVRCTTGEDQDKFGSNKIVKVLSSWCQNSKNIIDCLSPDVVASAHANPLDFFISLTFNKDALRAKSDAVCSKFKEKQDKVTCADSSNETLAGICASEFSSGMAHVFMLHKEKDLPMELLREVACDVVLQTTFCLRDTLLECQDDVQAVLLSYYSLFTNDSCLAKERPPKQETVAAKCAREAVQTLPSKQTEPEPKSLLDFLILGLKTDCETFSVRFACYKRELSNITNFRDFWLSLTFDHDNAVTSQKAYCEQVDKQIIPGITNACFNKSQPGLAACEVSFAREVDAIREEWFRNPEFDGLQLQTLACRTSVTRAACLDNAMQACGLDVSRAMAFSEIGILPDICRRLLTAKTSLVSGLNPSAGSGNNTESAEISQLLNETQVMSDMIGQFDNKELGKYERPLADQPVSDHNLNTSAEQSVDEEYIDTPLKKIDGATPMFQNETIEKDMKGGSMLRRNATAIRRQSGQGMNNSGHGVAMVTVFMKMVVVVFVCMMVVL